MLVYEDCTFIKSTPSPSPDQAKENRFFLGMTPAWLDSI